jgi:hypothetical protein
VCNIPPCSPPASFPYILPSHCANPQSGPDLPSCLPFLKKDIFVCLR